MGKYTAEAVRAAPKRAPARRVAAIRVDMLLTVLRDLNWGLGFCRRELFIIHSEDQEACIQH